MGEDILPCECGVQPTVRYWGGDGTVAKMDIYCDQPDHL